MQKKITDALSKIPKEGFIKVSGTSSPDITSAQKAALIRKGNEFFNRGEVEKAGRIFLTTSYTDGLVRMGDYYRSKNNHLEAIRMYWLAPAPDKVETCIAEMSAIVSKWLKDD